ncbi:hypothetical protein ACFYKX_13950 [Cytobacillus sp. FJAT-54145]|uniref:Lipopolysaccharide biosynthesis protein n=1 Tax=Cytobacillus spartinae TaxID=3299023 RepID=A0ABW6KFP4_9BACI
MAEEKNKYVLYEYLLFFWKKKWFFLIIPAITTVLVVGAIYAFNNDKPYTGKLLFYTGSLDSQDLTHPNNIMAKFNGELKGTLDVFVSEKGQVKFTVKGDSQDEVESDMELVKQVYTTDLMANYQKRLDASMVHLELLEERVPALEAIIEDYKEKLLSEEETLAPDELTSLSSLINETEEELTKAAERAHKMRGDIAFFEQPKVLSESVTKTKTYLKESIAVGVLLGLVLTVALLVLLKYLGFARRYYKHD